MSYNDTIRLCKCCQHNLIENGLDHFYSEIVSSYFEGFPIVEKQGANGYGSTMARYLELDRYITTIEINRNAIALIPNPNKCYKCS